MICPGVFVDNARWAGVPLSLLLSSAGIKPGATTVAFYAAGRYTEVASLADAQSDAFYLAHTVNGQPLPVEHGYPLRLVERGRYGGRWAKWVERIEVR